MHDVAEILDLAQFCHADRARLTDAADVVAREIDEHRVLRTFLRVSLEVRGESRILSIIAAAAARAGNWVRVDRIACDLDEHLRRSADELDGAEVEVEHVGRRIDLAQTAVEMEARLRDLLAELARGHDLEDIAREDVLLGLVDGLQEVLRRLAEFLEEVDLLAALGRLTSLRRERCREACLDLRDHLDDGIVRLIGIAPLRISQADEAGAVVQRIVDDEDAADYELAQEFLLAEFHAAHAVERRDDVVVEVADHAAVRERQRSILDGRPIALHVRLERLNRLAHDALHQAILVDHELVLEDLQAGKRLRSDEREAAELLMCRVDGFENEALLLADELIVNVDRRVEIHVDLLGDSDEIRLRRQLAERLPRWFEFHDDCSSHVTHRISDNMAVRHPCRTPHRGPRAWRRSAPWPL